MCQERCVITNIITDTRLKISGQITGWKVLCITGGRLKSVYFNHTWEPGINKANKAKYLTMEQAGQANIHVFLRKKDAMQYIMDNDKSIRLIPVTCKKEHFMGAGKNFYGCRTAMFTQVELSQEEYDKAMKGA